MAWMRLMSSAPGTMKRPPAGPLATAVNPGQPTPATPERRGPAAHHHLWSVAGLVQEDRLEVLVAIDAEPVENVAREETRPEPLAPNATGLPLRSSMVR